MNTQDIHFGTLLDALNPNKRESQNWGIDISQHLETYLEQLALENTSATNFAEAALLLQNSVVIYTRKVDHLWNLTVRVLENLHQSSHGKKKDQLPLTDNADDSGTTSDQPAAQRNKDKDSTKKKYARVNINLSEKSLEHARSGVEVKTWKFLPDRYHLLFKGKSTAGGKSNDPSTEDTVAEVRFLLSSLAMHHEMLEDELSHPGQHHVSFTILPSSPHDSLGCDDLPMDDDNMSHHEDCNPTDQGDAADPLSVPTEEEERVAHATKSRADNIVNAPPPDIEKEPDPWEPVPFDTKCYPEEPIGKKNSVKRPNIETLENTNLKRKQGQEVCVERCKEMSLPLYFLHALKPHPDMDDEIFSCSIWYKAKVQRGLFAEIRHLPDFAKNYDEFADFHGFEDYESERRGRTGGFHGFPEDGLEEEDDPVNNDDDLPDQHNEPPAEDSIQGNDDEIPLMQNSTLEEIAVERLAAGLELDSNAAMSQRVAEWHDSVRPKLTAAHQRGHFDIHEHGTRILETFETRGMNTISMQDMVADVPTQDVARYFLAALQLANTYNVEIKTPPEALTMDQISFTLLSTERHHEALEDYMAPSQGDNAAPIRSSGIHYVQPPHHSAAGTSRRRTELGKKRHRE